MVDTAILLLLLLTWLFAVGPETHHEGDPHRSTIELFGTSQDQHLSIHTYKTLILLTLTKCEMWSSPNVAQSGAAG